MCTAIQIQPRILVVEILNVRRKMFATGTWRCAVNSFRFAIRRTVRIAFRAFFVVQGRAEGGVLTGIYPGRRSRFTEWSVVCKESRRSPDLCVQRSDAQFLLVGSRGMRAYSSGRRADIEGKIATVLKTARRSGRNRVKNDSGERERVDYAKTAGAYGWTSTPLFTIVALRTESHLKSTQFFEDSLNPRSGPCASPPLPLGASSWIRGCLRVLRSASKLCYFR